MLFPKIWIICRVCLKQQEEMFNIYDESIYIKNIWSLLRDCGGVPVRKSDDLPDKICEACLNRLSKAYNFRVDCQRGHRELVQLLMARNISLYEIDLKEEKKSCTDVISISQTSTDGNPTPSSVVRSEQKIFTELSENSENIPTIFSENNSSIENESTKHVIKQYCVVKKNENNNESILEKNTSPPNTKEHIVLLLKLKKDSSVETQTETNTKNNAPTKTRARTKTKTKLPNKTKSKLKENTKLKANTIRSKSKSKHKSKGKLKFTCNICNNSYQTYDNLRHHKYIHQRPYQCKICKKSFSQTHSLLSHNNLHTGIRPYYCRICYKTFSDISNRNFHERSQHVIQKFKCDKCDKVFRFLSLLERHKQSHRPKKCLICNKEFASHQMVRHHHQVIHLKLLYK